MPGAHREEPDAADTMNVLHFPTTIGGNPPALAAAERSIGLDSTCISDVRYSMGYEADEFLCSSNAGPLQRAMARCRAGRRLASQYDLVHFNGGQSCLNRYGMGLDLPLWRRRGARLFMTFQGGDIRPESVLFPEHARTMRGRISESCRRRFLARATKWCEQLFCLNPDLLRHVEGAQFLPYCSVDPSLHQPTAREPSKRLRVVHAPTSRGVKGSEHVFNAREALGEEEYDWRMLEGISHEDVLQELDQADVVIDQFRIGWYGAFAVEAMARAIPTICWINEADLALTPPRFASAVPLVRADGESLVDVLRDLKEDPARREQLGKTSREFTVEFHDPARIATAMVELYAGRSRSFWDAFEKASGH